MASGRHHVYIVEVDGKLLVRPSIGSVDREKGPLGIRNLTAYQAWIHFPIEAVDLKKAEKESLLEVVDRKHVRVGPIAPGGSVPVTLQGGASGFFRYSVTLSGNRVVLTADGESAPGMIVDP